MWFPLGANAITKRTTDLEGPAREPLDRKSTRLNSSHGSISYAVFCLKKKKKQTDTTTAGIPTRTTAARHPAIAIRQAPDKDTITVPQMPQAIGNTMVKPTSYC